MAMPWVTDLEVERVAVTPSDMVMPWLTERLNEAWADAVAERLIGWLTSLPLPTATVTPSDIAMPWVTDFCIRDV
ncbi:hypothetical protein ES703_100116 [subsurface metagenome]